MLAGSTGFSFSGKPWVHDLVPETATGALPGSPAMDKVPLHRPRPSGTGLAKPVHGLGACEVCGVRRVARRARGWWMSSEAARNTVDPRQEPVLVRVVCRWHPVMPRETPPVSTQRDGSCSCSLPTH